MKKSIIRFSIIAFLLTLITACGSGGGGAPSPQQQSNPSTQPTQTPTVTPQPTQTPTVTPPPTITPTVTPPPTITKLVVTKSTSSPVPTDMLRTNTKYMKRTAINIKNPTGVNQEVTISSISIKGGLSVNIVNVQIMSGNKVLGTGILSGEKAYFQSITIEIPAGTSKKLTIQAKLNPYMQPLVVNEWIRKVKFGFTADDIISSQAQISGLPVWGNYAYIEKGTLLYPCTEALCSANMETDKTTILWRHYNTYQSVTIPIRDGKSVVFEGENIPTIMSLSLSSLIASNVGIGGNFGTRNNTLCSTYQYSIFDFSKTADLVAITVTCTTIGQGDQSDIMLLKTDGSYNYVRVTNDSANEISPMIGSPGGVMSNNLTVLFIKGIKNNNTIGLPISSTPNPLSIKTGEIWKTTVDVNTDTVSNETLVAKDVYISGMLSVGYDRIFSINEEYTKLVYVKDVENVAHLFIANLNGSDKVDVGEGSNPYWATDGSNRIIFSTNNNDIFKSNIVLWIMDGDGKNRRKMIIPDNFNKLTGSIILSSTSP